MYLTFFVIKHIPSCGIDLISVVSLRMLKWEAITQQKGLSNVHAQFSGTSKQVVVDLELSKDEENLIVGLEKKKEERVKPTDLLKRNE